MKTIRPEEARDLNISAESLQLAQRDDYMSDKKFETEPISYFQDAMIRFKKNKASVTAFWILLVIFLYAIIVPFVSPFKVSDREPYYQKVLPKSKLFSSLGIEFWDGMAVERVNQSIMDLYSGIGEELANGQGNDAHEVNPVKKIYREYETTSTKGRREVVTQNYEIRLDHYRRLGIVERNLTSNQYNKLIKWQNATKLQVIYPAVTTAKSHTGSLTDDPNVYYETNRRGEAKRDKDGNLTLLYAETNPENYTSLRIKGDPGNWAYYRKTQTGMTVRVDYYNYYRYIYSKSKISSDLEDTSGDEYLIGSEPSFFFGTNQNGQDIFSALANGARFSFIMAIVIATTNIIIGAIIGALEGYYGDPLDMIVERIKDILIGVPFMVTIVLFQLHLQKHVGVIGTLFFAFILTGWIGTSGLTRTQFYRFKNQEYVLAARTLGANDRRIITKHIFPNAIGTFITSTILVIPGFIFTESSLSYLGIINLATANTTSVGTLLAGGDAYMQQYPHIIFFPSVFISLLLISFNLFGNGLRDAFNPSLRGADE